MIETNMFVCAAIAVISNFCSTVHLPSAANVHSVQDLQAYTVGSPNSPVDFFCVSTMNVHFALVNGAVREFSCPGSYFYRQSTDRDERFEGEALLSSNQIVAIAGAACRSLSSAEVDPTLGKVLLYSAVESNKKTYPFSRVQWLSGLDSPLYTAEVEVDARDGTIVSMSLLDKAFANLSWVERAKRSYFKNEPARNPKSTFDTRHPTTNDFVLIKSHTEKLCSALRLKSSELIRADTVDWTKSFLSARDSTSSQQGSGTDCVFNFKDSRSFIWALDGTVISCAAPDVIYCNARTQPGWQDPDWLQGKITKNWHQLVSDFETSLRENIGIPKPMLDGYFAVLPDAPSVGSTNKIRAYVRWFAKANFIGVIAAPICAEFDLQTGETKLVAFHDSGFYPYLKAFESGLSQGK